MAALPPGASMRDIFDYCQKNNLLSLAQGMIELPPPALLRQLSVALLEHDATCHQYRTRFGEPVFLQGVQNLLRTRYGANLTTDSILATSGVSGGIFASLTMLSKSGKNRIGLVEPFYTYHLRHAQLVTTPENIKTIASNADFSPNFDNIEASLRDGVKVIIVTNPGNPSGRVWSRDEIQRLLTLTRAHNCTLILDEVYSEMVWRDRSHYSPVHEAVSEDVIVIRGFSKTLCCQSWRVGYLISSPVNIPKIMAVHDPVYISVSWQQQALGKYLSDHMEDFTRHVSDVGALMQSNWQILRDAFRDVFGWQPVEPDGSMYGCFLHGKATDMEAVNQALLAGVGIAPGTMFYGNTDHTGMVRIHCGVTGEKAQQIVDKLRSATH